MSDTSPGRAPGAKVNKPDADFSSDLGKLQETKALARMFLRAVWAQQWNEANPGATKEARAAAWLEVRDQVMKSNLAPYRRALNTLARNGVTMSLPKNGAPAEDDGED